MMERIGKDLLNDEALCKLMVDTHGARFDGRVWDVFDEVVVPALPEQPAVVDLGCGPGLFLFDICQRLPSAHLVGLDTSGTMLDFAANLSWPAGCPELIQASLEAGSFGWGRRFNLVAMNFFLHQFDYPLGPLASALAALEPGGLLWFYDWARQPLADYLNFWEVDPASPGAERDPTLAYRLFPLHNRFTRDDWLYVFSSAGIEPLYELPRAGGQHLLMVLEERTARQPGGR